MTFEDALYDVNTKMEDRAFGAVKQDITNQGCKTLGETVRLLEIGANTEGLAILKVEVGGKEKCVLTNRKAEYFDGLWFCAPIKVFNVLTNSSKVGLSIASESSEL